MYRFKEVKPIDTIEKINKYLETVGISINEEWFDSGITNVFSVRITIDGTTYGTNGKGCTKDFALASAYGELMERLGNGVLFKLGERQKTEECGFRYFPDECVAGVYKYIDVANNDIVSRILSSIDDREKAINYWNAFYPNQVCVPFTNTITCEKIYVPYSMLQVYGSNGMAAGNSSEESFVQAVSEIFERYCLQRIIMEKICPPVINMEYVCSRFPTIGRMLKDIEGNGEYSFEIRDCGLNLGFPVISVCLRKKDDNSYAVSLGAHPCLESAIERAITELFQGRNISSVCESHFQKISRNEKLNLLSLLKNGRGIFPDSFFANEYNYMPFAYDGYVFENNKQMKMFIINLLTNLNASVFSHSILLGGIYITHVIIPGYSEVYLFDEMQFKILDMQRRLKKVFNKLFLVPNVELQTYLEFIDYSRKSPEYDNNLSKNIKDDNKEEKKRQLLLLLSGFYKLRRYDRCRYYLELLADYVDRLEYECINELFCMHENENGNQDIWNMLGLKYGLNVCDSCKNMINLKSVIEMHQRGIAKDYANSKKWLDCVKKIKEDMVAI